MEISTPQVSRPVIFNDSEKHILQKAGCLLCELSAGIEKYEAKSVYQPDCDVYISFEEIETAYRLLTYFEEYIGWQII